MTFPAPTLDDAGATPSQPPPSDPARGRGWWLVTGSIVGVITLAWGTLQIVDVLAHEERTATTAIDRPVSVVDVDNHAGSVTVIAGPVDSVTVTADISEGLASGDLVQQVDSDRLVVRASCPAFGSTWCSVDYTIEVPVGTVIRLRSQDDNVRVTGPAGDVTATTPHGTVVLDELASRTVTVRSDHGNVTVRFAEAPVTVDATSEHGDVTVVVPDAADFYALDVDSRHGDVRTDVRTDPASDRSIRARSSHGDVTVRYPA